MNILSRMSLLALVLMMCACQKNSMGGGQDIGGGNVISSNNVTNEDVEKFVHQIESKREFIFNSMELTSLIASRITNLDPSILKTIESDELRKYRFQSHLHELFFREKDYFQIVRREALVDLVSSGPCRDGYGQPVDASIFGMNQPICMSSERLVKKLKKDNYQIQILSLYVHEVSHLFGANEEEATELQNEVLNIGPNFVNYFSFLFESPKRIQNSVQKLKELALAASVATERAEKCQKLQSLFDESYKLFIQDNGQKITISFLKVEDIVRTHAVFVASAFAKDYCESDWSGGKQNRLAKWKGKTEVSIGEIYPDPLTLVSFFESKERTMILSQYLLADLSGLRIRRVPEGDLIGLQWNLNAILNELNQIQVPGEAANTH